MFFPYPKCLPYLTQRTPFHLLFIEPTTTFIPTPLLLSNFYTIPRSRFTIHPDTHIFFRHTFNLTNTTTQLYSSHLNTTLQLDTQPYPPPPSILPNIYHTSSITTHARLNNILHHTTEIVGVIKTPRHFTFIKTKYKIQIQSLPNPIVSANETQTTTRWQNILLLKSLKHTKIIHVKLYKLIYNVIGV